ncbi:hypothetical protein GCM10023238_07110 [Streptomyces heliomycini]
MLRRRRQRREFIDVLSTAAATGAAAERAERFGCGCPHEHASPSPGAWAAYYEGRPGAAAGGARPDLPFGDRSILLTHQDGRLLCIAPGTTGGAHVTFAKQGAQPPTDAAGRVGRPAVGSGGVVQSYEEALSSLAIAERLGLDDPVLHASDLLV